MPRTLGLRELLAALFLLAGLGPSLAQSGSHPSQEAMLDAVIDSTCSDTGEPVKPSSYLVALHSGHPYSVREPDTEHQRRSSRTSQDTRGRVLASLVIFFRVGDTLRPLTLRSIKGGGFAYLIDCGSSQIETHPQHFPTMQIIPQLSEDASTLFEMLQDRTNAPADSVAGKLVLFSGQTPSSVLERVPSGKLIYGDLLSAYTAQNIELSFMDGYTGGFSVIATEGASEIRRSARGAPRRSQQDAAADTPPRGDASAPADDRASNEVVISEPVERQTRRNVLIQLSPKTFAGLDLTKQGVVDTFGYCNGPVRAEKTPGTYAISGCVTDAAQQIALQIGDFEPLAIKVGKQALALDNLLRTRGYVVPLPPEWQGSAGAVVTVPAGQVASLLRRRIAINQMGLPGCAVSISLSAENLSQRTVNFPPPPCRTIGITLPRKFFAKTRPAITDGCLPGSREPVSVRSDGRVTCVIGPSDERAKAKAITLQWASGYAPIPLSIKLGDVRDQAVALSDDDVLPFLRPDPRLAAISADRASVPAYGITEVQYLVGQQSCSALRPRDGEFPSVAEAKCGALPNRLRLVFEMDSQQIPKGVPADAFLETFEHVVLLDSADASSAFDLRKLRRNMPIRFNDERLQRYSDEYVGGSELLIKGARVYNEPNCTGTDTVATFDKAASKATYQWPIFARVNDNDNNPLTNCATAMIERDQNDRPYLTFDFKSTRAVGPRRIILVARSEELMGRRGMPQALDEALRRFIKAAQDLQENGAPLSPIDVMTVSQDGTMRRLFSGEEAALDPQAALAAISKLDRTAPRTPDLSAVKLQPELKDAERITMVMDGSNVTPRQHGESRLLASDLAARKGALTFLLSARDACQLWLAASKDLRCEQIGEMTQARREAKFDETFIGMLNQVSKR